MRRIKILGHATMVTYCPRDDSDVYSIATAEEIINEARVGHLFILVDDEDRENEGDLVIPAEFATPAAINFMAMYGRGLICATITEEHARKLALPMMAPSNGDKLGTAFTVSVDARCGVTTGISAHDRATTVAALVADDAARDDLATPGHMFPLVARKGGVLVREGHTEASVDVSRLAGLAPAGVICEILNDDGTMARLKDLIPYARRHNLKIGTIASLVAYRKRTEALDTDSVVPFHRPLAACPSGQLARTA